MKVDFRSEWSSWLMVLAMIIISMVINPSFVPAQWDAMGILGFLLRAVAFPFIAVALASIPVLIVCWIAKIIPDIDYSMRVAFLFMFGMLIYHIINH